MSIRRLTTATRGTGGGKWRIINFWRLADRTEIDPGVRLRRRAIGLRVYLDPTSCFIFALLFLFDDPLGRQSASFKVRIVSSDRSDDNCPAEATKEEEKVEWEEEEEEEEEGCVGWFICEWSDNNPPRSFYAGGVLNEKRHRQCRLRNRNGISGRGWSIPAIRSYPALFCASIDSGAVQWKRKINEPSGNCGGCASILSWSNWNAQEYSVGTRLTRRVTRAASQKELNCEKNGKDEKEPTWAQIELKIS